MDTIAIERSIWINAPRERVWRAITDPADVQRWFAPGTTFKTSGAGVGSRLYVEHPETGAELFVQILEVMEPPARLVMRSQVVPPEPAFVTEYRLSEENSGTRLTLIHSGYEALPGDVRDQIVGQNTDGFERMLENVRAAVEGVPLPHPQGF